MSGRMLPLFKTREVGMACFILAGMTFSAVNKFVVEFEVAQRRRDLIAWNDALAEQAHIENQYVLNELNKQLGQPPSDRRPS